VAVQRLSLADYQLAAQRTDQNRKHVGLRGLAFPLLGLFGEVGTLLSALKKKQRDRDSFVGYEETVVEEFGDILWYLSNISLRLGTKLSALAHRARRSRQAGHREEKRPVETFGDLQASKSLHGSATSSEFETALIALAAKVGAMLGDFQQRQIANNRDLLPGRLPEIFCALVEAANVADVDLAEVAAFNLRKIRSRWPERREYTRLFDESFGPIERFPRTIRMHIFETRRSDKTYVIQQCNGIHIGAALTDNRMRPDDYRFHDVFHLAYAAILGWSPVLRALFNLKRNSQPKVDEAQDGARAIIIEEGISTLVFHRAEQLKYFASIKSLDYSLLKQISDFVRGYEVDQCPLWQWEQAILEGYKVFRQLRRHRRGIVIANLAKRSISFERLPP
jgi:NTP pyrophosphatase (non-canonical NTP hydrolase)